MLLSFYPVTWARLADLLDFWAVDAHKLLLWEAILVQKEKK
jgi:hypothetical protein